MAMSAVAEAAYKALDAWLAGEPIGNFLAGPVTLEVGNEVSAEFAGTHTGAEEVARVLTAVIRKPRDIDLWQGAEYTGYPAEAHVGDYHLSMDVDGEGRINRARLTTIEGFAVRSMLAAYLGHSGDVDEFFAAGCRYHADAGEGLPYVELFDDLEILIDDPEAVEIEIKDWGVEHNIEAVLATEGGPVSFFFHVDIHGKIGAVHRRSAEN